MKCEQLCGLGNTLGPRELGRGDEMAGHSVAPTSRWIAQGANLCYGFTTSRATQGWQEAMQ